MLKQLKYFQSVVRLGSFSAAAEENFISQSAISQQVQSLERELGFALLVRKNRSFSLTPAGEYFYRKSLLLTAACDRMCAEAAKIAKGGEGAHEGLEEVLDGLRKMKDPVEQNAAAALKLSDWAYVLEVGQITLDGTGEQLLGDDRVRRAYLGED